jgi:MFS superfamily sulfate permease-like transporter
VLLTLLFLAALFENLPLATLAAVVIHALWRSSDPRKLAPFWQMNRFDFVLGAITLVAVLLFDTLPAVVIGVVLSLVVLIYRVSFPRSAELGRDPATGEFEDLDLHPEAERVPGVCVYRFDAPLAYSNAHAFVDGARQLVRASDPTPHTFVVDGEVMGGIDSTGLEALSELVDLMESAGIKVVLARFHRSAVEGIRRNPNLDDQLLELMAHRPSQAASRAQRDSDPSSDTGGDGDGDGAEDGDTGAPE